MAYDFTKTLYKGEQILWQDESSPNAPEPDVNDSKQNRWIFMFMLLGGIVLMAIGFAGRLDGIDKLGCAVVGAVAVMVIIAMMINQKSFKQQYYCLTNRRLLVADARGSITEHLLAEAESAAVTKTNGEYGSLLIFTRIFPQQTYWEHFNRRNMNGVTYDKQIWSIRGVRYADRLCALLNNAIQTAASQQAVYIR